MEFKAIGYIYSIVSKTEGKVYIGSTIQKLEKRWNDHRGDLRRQKHDNYKLTILYAHYGLEDLIFTCEHTIEFNDYQELIDIEGIEIRHIPEDWSLNISRYPEINSMYGRKQSEESRKLISIGNSGENNPNYRLRGENSPNWGTAKHKKGHELFLHFPNGSHYVILNNLRFSKNFGLNRNYISDLATKRLKSYKGITGEYAPKWLVDKVKPLMGEGIYWIEIDEQGNIIE